MCLVNVVYFARPTGVAGNVLLAPNQVAIQNHRSVEITSCPYFKHGRQFALEGVSYNILFIQLLCIFRLLRRRHSPIHTIAISIVRMSPDLRMRSQNGWILDPGDTLFPDLEIAIKTSSEGVEHTDFTGLVLLV